jgi:hypothetical protein
MPNRRRRLSVAAFAAFALGVTSAPLVAQDTNTIGPPQLKDYRLPGQRTTPPPAQGQTTTAQQPAPQQTPPAAAQPAPHSAAPATPAPPRPERQAPRRTAPAAPPPGAAAEPARRPAAPPPAATVPAQPPAQVAPAPPAQTAPAPAPGAAAPAPESRWTWLWIAGAAILALLALLGFRRLSAIRAEARRRARREERAAARAAEAAAAPEPEPEPEPADAGPRARLELGFAPDRAVATESETVVHYELVLRNAGDEIARNIRIDTRMFNASARSAVGAFLEAPIHDHSGSPHVTIAPGGELKLGSAIAMPKEEVRGIEVQGRSIFVPIVAINVAYDWGESGAGRTSRSWLVGREPETPSEKMGAFRLDLGPRIYRSVGQRPTELANVA